MSAPMAIMVQNYLEKDNRGHAIFAGVAENQL
jgi:hypothetical protein